MSQDDVDAGRNEVLASGERAELARLRRELRVMEIEILKRPSAYVARENSFQMGFRLVQELAADGINVAVACRMLKVSRSGYYEWRERPPSA